MTNALARMSTQEREKELLSQVHIAEDVYSRTDLSWWPIRFQTRSVVLGHIKCKEKETEKIVQITGKSRYVSCNLFWIFDSSVSANCQICQHCFNHLKKFPQGFNSSNSQFFRQFAFPSRQDIYFK